MVYRRTGHGLKSFPSADSVGGASDPPVPRCTGLAGHDRREKLYSAYAQYPSGVFIMVLGDPDSTASSRSEQINRRDFLNPEMDGLDDAHMPDLTGIAAGGSDLQRGYNHFASELKKVVAFDSLAIYSVDGAHEHEVIEYCSGLALPRSKHGARRPLPGSRTSYVMATEQTLVSGHLGEYPWFDNDQGLLDLGLHSSIAVCLAYQGRTVAILELGSCREGAYGPREQGLLEHLADKLAPAVAFSLRSDQAGVNLDDSAVALARLKGALDGVLAGILSAEQQLREFASIVESTPCAVIITDGTGNIEYVNPSYSRMTGYLPEDVLGTLVGISGAQGISAEEYLYRWNAMIADGAWKEEARYTAKDGEGYWSSRILFPLRNSEGTITRCIVIEEDVTEKRMLQEQLVQIQKMESTGRMAGGVAHDLNNLLVAMLGYASLMQARLDPTEEGYEYARNIEDLVGKASELTCQLMPATQQNPEEPKPMDVNLAVREVFKILSHTATARHDLRIVSHLQPDLPVIVGDTGQVQQVIMNICFNALDAMPEGGELDVSTRAVQLEHGVDNGGSSLPSGFYVEMCIKDTGVGISRDLQARIFEPFFTTKLVGKGTGLGLSVAQLIVKNHGGIISVESSPGEGSVFTIYLPCPRN